LLAALVFNFVGLKMIFLFSGLDAADDRVIFGSDLGAGYPYTDLVYGVPDMNGQLLYAGLFQPENISKFQDNSFGNLFCTLYINTYLCMVNNDVMINFFYYITC
jgi:hypothetical protein